MTFTYGLKSAVDLLQKLRRDRERLKKQVTPDRFFNFVVTGYHIIDWIGKDPTVPKSAKGERDSMYGHPHIAVCQDLANAGKHFTLEKRSKKQRDPIVAKTSAISSGPYGSGAYGEGPYGGGESVVIVLTDGRRLDALELADGVVAVWEAFFVKHGMLDSLNA